MNSRVLIIRRMLPILPMRAKEFLPAVARRIPLCDGVDVGVVHSCWQLFEMVGRSGGKRIDHGAGRPKLRPFLSLLRDTTAIL